MAITCLAEDLIAAMGPTQFGAGQQGVAHLEVEQGRAPPTLLPDRELVAMNVESVCGSVGRADTLEVVLLFAKAARLAQNFRGRADMAGRAPLFQPAEPAMLR